MLIGTGKRKKIIMFFINQEFKCGKNTNYVNSLNMRNKLQSSMLHVTLFSIQLLTYNSVKNITSLFFCGDIHSVAIIVSVCDLNR